MELSPAQQAASSLPETLLIPAEHSVIVLDSSKTVQSTLSPAPFATAPSSVSAPAISTTVATASTTARGVTGLRLLIISAKERFALAQMRQGKQLQAQRLLRELVVELKGMLAVTRKADRQLSKIQHLLESVYTELAKIAAKGGDLPEETRLKKLAQQLDT